MDPVLPPDYPILQQKVKNLSRYSFIRTGCIGQSSRGRRILSIFLGNPNSKVLFTAAFHGMEWITTLLMLCFTQELCEAVENRQLLCGIDVSAVLKKRGLCVLPCINPDGVHIQLKNPEKKWQANARGVDLNHNFNAGWRDLKQRELAAGITGPGPTRFGGTKPESEPESAALARFCRRVPFRYALAFHTQGEEIYYDFGPNTPACSEKMAQALATAAGYRICRPEGLAVGGGFKDWFIDCFGRPAFTIEAGLGENPLPLQELESLYARLEPMMVRALCL